ncbi:MAG: hypothetical protein ACI88G_000658 [Woeseiaceae bacterium]
MGLLIIFIILIALALTWSWCAGGAGCPQPMTSPERIKILSHAIIGKVSICGSIFNNILAHERNQDTS